MVIHFSQNLLLVLKHGRENFYNNSERQTKILVLKKDSRWPGEETFLCQNFEQSSWLEFVVPLFGNTPNFPQGESVANSHLVLAMPPPTNLENRIENDYLSFIRCIPSEFKCISIIDLTVSQ